MKILLSLATLILLAGGFLYGQNLIANGDFELDYTVGWSAETTAVWNPALGDTLDRATGFDGDPDNELRVKKYDADYVKVFQTVSVNSTDLVFKADVKFYALEENPSEAHWAAANIVLAYLDDSSVLLGETRILYKTPHCPYANTPTFHMIEINDTVSWQSLDVSITSELANLTGVNPTDIKKITVAIYDTTDGC